MQLKDPDPLQIINDNKNKIQHNTDLYWLNGWGSGYFQINENGDIIIKPNDNNKSINLYEMVKSLVQRGIEPPILFRFDRIIRDRISKIYSAFDNAIKEHNYKNSYQLAYPIKVNQQKHVVDVICKGTDHNIILEVGSKPELIAILPHMDTKDSMFLCNGYKDAKYIELALLSKKIGKRPIIIIEQLYELNMVLQISEKLNVEPEIGIRIKPSSKGSGKWALSGGDQAKFGLNIHEINQVVKELKDKNKEHYLKLLHFHAGSQITSIIPLKKVLREASRMYVEIAKLCPSMSFLDIGGGLGIDYDGSKTTSDCSMNYTLEQYARDVVYTIGSICQEEKINPPVIISESGRAIVAHHSILITEVLDVAYAADAIIQPDPPLSNIPILRDLYDIYCNVSDKNCTESLHDGSDLKENVIEKFIQGDLTLTERAYAEKIFGHLIAKILNIGKKLDYVPEEIKKLEENLLDIYFCNFSVFQSLPDAWAIQQLFPIMPIHRLNTTPTRKATIVDVTCDSDGTINKFVRRKKNSKWLPLHEKSSEPYYLGIFLVGAYQETLGSLHNLFGDANAIHVDLDDNGQWEIKHQISGDTIGQVLKYMQYKTDDLSETLRTAIEKGLKNNILTLEESVKLKQLFKQALESYTYLVV